MCGCGDDVCLSACLSPFPHSHNIVLANSHQIQWEVEVSKTIKFLKNFLLLLTSAGRKGERHE